MSDKTETVGSRSADQSFIALNRESYDEAMPSQRLARTTDRGVRKRIRKLRVELGLSLNQVGVPGASGAYVSYIEAGSRRPSIEVLIHLADRLGTTALYLMTGNKHGHCPVCGRGHDAG